ncbi:hypothetical protein I7656_25545 (plasmid) [Salmonella enterica subsp. enterica serovar Typhimurium]|uniref:hypothetical protein n=1 Tax=Salmonella enterica TaxID=28901 RepID=UPI0018D73258|nr:hypothetical protein [Salmonella enterica]QPQ70225.1 hypothetical protein I7656_25545 [Salmonella enterica subsp. enterica serovar Typhimurium]
MSHVLEGASQEDLNLYRAEVERDQAYGNWRDFFLNKKGSVTSVSGALLQIVGGDKLIIPFC